MSRPLPSQYILSINISLVSSRPTFHTLTMQALTFLTLSFLSFTPALAQDLVAALQADPDLSTLLSAISAVPGLADTLDAAEGITIFAPTNEAFAAVDPDSAEGTAIGASDVPGIASILSYHVVPATIPSTAITETPQFVQTLLTPANLIGGEVAALVPGGQYLGAQVVDGNVVLKSGLLQTSTVTQAVCDPKHLTLFITEVVTDCLFFSFHRIL